MISLDVKAAQCGTRLSSCSPVSLPKHLSQYNFHSIPQSSSLPNCKLSCKSRGICQKQWCVSATFQHFFLSPFLQLPHSRKSLTFICMWCCSSHSATCWRDPLPGPVCSSRTWTAWSSFQESLRPCKTDHFHLHLTFVASHWLNSVVLLKREKKISFTKTEPLDPASILKGFSLMSKTLHLKPWSGMVSLSPRQHCSCPAFNCFPDPNPTWQMLWGRNCSWITSGWEATVWGGPFSLAQGVCILVSWMLSQLAEWAFHVWLPVHAKKENIKSKSLNSVPHHHLSSWHEITQTLCS